MVHEIFVTICLKRTENLLEHGSFKQKAMAAGHGLSCSFVILFSVQKRRTAKAVLLWLSADAEQSHIQAFPTDPKISIFSLTVALIASKPGARSLRGSYPLPCPLDWREGRKLDLIKKMNT